MTSYERIKIYIWIFLRKNQYRGISKKKNLYKGILVKKRQHCFTSNYQGENVNTVNINSEGDGACKIHGMRKMD